MQARPCAPPHGGVQPLMEEALPNRQPVPHLGSSSRGEYPSAWSYNLPVNSAPWLPFCLLKQCKSRLIKFFLLLSDFRNNCPVSLLRLLFSASISSGNFSSRDEVSGTLTIPAAGSGYAVVCQLLSESCHSELISHINSCLFIQQTFMRACSVLSPGHVSGGYKVRFSS